jgi:serine/threonine protein kinase
MVMEYVNCDNLETAIKVKRNKNNSGVGTSFNDIRTDNSHSMYFEESIIWRCLIQCLVSLDYIHSKKVIHRDVKTDNIFISVPGKTSQEVLRNPEEFMR